VTLREFSRRAGWPYRELLATDADEFFGMLLALGMTLRVVPRLGKDRDP
jgi:hypothetical protein